MFKDLFGKLTYVVGALLYGVGFEEVVCEHEGACLHRI